MFDETHAQRDCTIRRDPGFIHSTEDWIVSGPHFYVANPFNKTPRRDATASGHYDSIDLESVPDDYLPRTIYRPMTNRDEYLCRTPTVPWTDPGQTAPLAVTNYYRVVFRRQLSQSGERTLISAVAPPRVAHINPVLSLTFQQQDDLINFSSMTASIVCDFFIKSTGRSDVYESTLKLMPIPDQDSLRDRRLLALVCVASHWRELWEDWHARNAAAPECLSWTRDSVLRTPFARRQALLEIDVLVAQSLNLTLDELLLIYRVQFALMQENERDTWYDVNGRIIFTSSKTFAGVGMPRKASPKDPEVNVTFPDGRVKKGRLGWEDVRYVPNGTTVSVTVMDDTLPGGPHQRERRWIAPFATSDREDDYRKAWEFFAGQRKTPECS
jgi:hypothetical protein